MSESSKAVFLSYASEDAESAQRICEALRAADVDVWFDKSELRGGDAWDQKIRRQIKDSALFMPIISANTDARPEGYFRLEWKLAVDRSHLMADDEPFLLPIVVDGTPDATTRVPDKFRSVQWTRLPGGSTPPAFVDRIVHLLARDPAVLLAARSDPRPTTRRPADAVKASFFLRFRYRLLLIASVAGLACAYLAIEEFVLAKRANGAAPATSGAEAPGEISEKSIAVLPFVNMSSDSAQDYLGDGVAAEITTKLAGLKGLLVKGRTGVARFKGTTLSAKEIGSALGVRWLLEGSVARVGNRIRVTTALLKAPDGFEVWSENTDAKVDDIFSMQEHIAARTAEALAVKLTPEERHSLSDWGTHSAAAYDEYLQGQILYEHVMDRARFEASLPHFERALVIDPGFAPAMAGLASVEAQMYRDFDSDPARLARADDLVRRALEIDPHLGRAVMAEAEIRIARYEYDGAAEQFALVTADEPDNYVAWDARCWAEGYRTPPHAAEAEQYCRRALQINPGHFNAEYHLARALLQQGKFAEADQAIAKVDELAPGSALGRAGHFWADLYEGRARQAIEALKTYSPTPLRSAWLTMAYGQVGDLDAAFGSLNLAMAGGYRDVQELRGSRWFAPLREDSRFEPLLRKYGVVNRPGNPGAIHPR